MSKATGLKLKALVKFASPDPNRYGLTAPWVFRAPKDSVFDGALVAAVTDGHMLACLRLPESLEPFVRPHLNKLLTPEAVTRLAHLPVEASFALLQEGDTKDPAVDVEAIGVLKKRDAQVVGSAKALREVERMLRGYTNVDADTRDIYPVVFLADELHTSGVTETVAGSVFKKDVTPSPVDFSGFGNRPCVSMELFSKLLDFMAFGPEVEFSNEHDLSPIVARTDERVAVLMPRRPEAHVFKRGTEPLLPTDLLKKEWLAPTPAAREGSSRVAGTVATPFPVGKSETLRTRWLLGNVDAHTINLDRARAYVQSDRKPRMFLLRGWAVEAVRLEFDLFEGTFLDQARGGYWKQSADQSGSWNAECWWGVAVEHGDMLRRFNAALFTLKRRVSHYDWPEHKKNETLKDIHELVRRTGSVQ